MATDHPQPEDVHGFEAEMERRMPSAHSYTAADFGPTHRWVVFVCERDGHPMRVGYTDEEYELCPACYRPLVPITVGPVSDAS